MRTTLTALILIVLTTLANHTYAQGFSYQGVLNDNGAPANGTYDIRARIIDPILDQPIGPDQINSVLVEDGLFSTIYQFRNPSNPLSGVLLELAVRQGADPFVTLPREIIFPTPYAWFAYDGDLTQISDGSIVHDGLDVVIGNDLSVTNSLEVGVSAEVGHTMIVGSTMIVGLDLSVGDRAIVGGDIVAGGDLVVVGDSQLGEATSIVDIPGDLEIGGDALIGDAGTTTTIQGDLLVAGDARKAQPELRSVLLTQTDFVDGGFLDRQLSSIGIGITTVPITAFAYAPIDLPDGAVIKAVSALVHDSDGDLGDNVRMRLYTQGFTESATERNFNQTSGSPGLTLLEFTTNVAVDRNNTDAFLHFQFDNNFLIDQGLKRVYSVEVQYQTDSIR